MEAPTAETALSLPTSNHKFTTMKTIKKASYQGYIWYSDATSPIVLNGEPFAMELDETKNPFVIEAQLWNEADHESIGIRYADGQYYTSNRHISEEELKDKTDDIETYIAHRMPGVAGLKFLRCWTARPDAFCNGFEVLEPEGMAFIGFEQKQKEE